MHVRIVASETSCAEVAYTKSIKGHCIFARWLFKPYKKSMMCKIASKECEQKMSMLISKSVGCVQRNLNVYIFCQSLLFCMCMQFLFEKLCVTRFVYRHNMYIATLHKAVWDIVALSHPIQRELTELNYIAVTIYFTKSNKKLLVITGI